MSISRKKALTITLRVAASISGTFILVKEIDKLFKQLDALEQAGAHFESEAIILSGKLSDANRKLLFLDGYLENALTEDQYNHLKNFGYL